MKGTDTLVLPADVLVTPVEALDPHLRRRLNHNDGEFVVSRPRYRGRSVVLDECAAAFLQQFRVPKTVVQAVLDHCAHNLSVALDVLEEVIPLVERVRRLRLLVEDGSFAVRDVEPTYAPGDHIAKIRLQRCVYLMDDTEVYEGENTDGGRCAVKLLRPDAPKKSRRCLEREASVLNRLAGQGVPRLLAQGTWKGQHYVVTQWCEGRKLSEAAAAMRGSEAPLGPQVLALCVAILEAYARLHETGLLHGDVHPNNIIVAKDSSVVLLDFGLSCSIEQGDAQLQHFGRAGVAEYLEPEYCEALERKQSLPAQTAAGEQYAIGALCYFLASGHHYLDFGLERDAWVKQILHQAPRSFTELGLQPHDSFQRVLLTALAKKPGQRHATVREFARALARQTRAIRDAPSLSRAARDMFAAVMSRHELSDGAIDVDLCAAPRCSLNYGASGIAYMLYRAAITRNDSCLLTTADLWSTWARERASEPDAFYSAQLGISEALVGPASLYHGEPGVQFVQALISHAMGDLVSCDAAARAFVASASRLCTNVDLTLGQSGILLGCAALYETLPDHHALIDKAGLCHLGEDLVPFLMASLVGDAMGEPGDNKWLGMAHGRAGVILALLRWRLATGNDVSGLEDQLAALAAFGRWNGKCATWPLHVGPRSYDRAPRTGWCHGSAGYVHLWALADEVFGGVQFARYAFGAAEHIWQARDTTSPVNGSLCCGYAGQGFAMLSLYRHYGDLHWLSRSHAFLDRAIARAHHTERRPSLYKGDVGIALLAAELEQPLSSATPVIDAEGWRGRP